MGNSNVHFEDAQEVARKLTHMQREMHTRIMTEIWAELEAQALEKAAKEIQSSKYRAWLNARAAAVRVGAAIAA
jgi:predicted thioredoxin/glutaredoxin